MEGGIFRTLVFAYPPLGFFLPDGLGEDLGGDAAVEKLAAPKYGLELQLRLTDRKSVV